MCVACAKPANVKWPAMKYMKNCFRNNSDGAGLAWVDTTGLHVKKGYFSFKELWTDMKELEQYPVLLHCRLATHGSIRAENCHPFLLSNNVAMVHNGIIPIVPLQKDMTDSETFGKKFIEPYNEDMLKSTAYQELLCMAIGHSSKIAMLTQKGKFIILNEEYGEVFQGIWFSNSSYEDDLHSFVDWGNNRSWGRRGKRTQKKNSKQTAAYFDGAYEREDFETDEDYEAYMEEWFRFYNYEDNYTDPFFASDRLPAVNEKLLGVKSFSKETARCTKEKRAMSM